MILQALKHMKEYVHLLLLRMNFQDYFYINQSFIPLNNADSFLLQDNVIFLRLESLKEELVFHDLSYVLKQKEDIFFLF